MQRKGRINGGITVVQTVGNVVAKVLAGSDGDKLQSRVTVSVKNSICDAKTLVFAGTVNKTKSQSLLRQNCKFDFHFCGNEID